MSNPVVINKKKDSFFIYLMFNSIITFS